VVLATQNPVGSAGTQMLPSAQMDRFMIKISMGYPDFESQISILRDRHTENPLNRISTVVNLEQLQEMIREANEVEVQDSVYEYVTRLTQATREHPLIQLGVSPRGALSLMKAAKGYAAIAGRDYVLPDDIKRAAHPVLEHRMVLENALRIRKNAAAEIIDDIIASVTVPTEAVFEARD
jgi:MoxR-like ATPase